MKKIFTLCLALFCATVSFAQDDEEFDTKGTFEFCDKDGNVIPDGSVITRTELEEGESGDLQIGSGIYAKQVKQKDDEGNQLKAGMHVNITELSGGSISSCWPGNCVSRGEVTEFDSPSTKAFSGVESIQTEWFPALDDEDNAIYGKASITLTLTANIKSNFGGDNTLGEASTITVKFVYADPTGINEVNSDANATVVARYAADGTRLSQPQKGLNILKLSNGKTMKYINK